MPPIASLLTLTTALILALPAFAAAERVPMAGFSVERPPGAAWVRLRAKGNMIVYRRRVPGTTTTVIAFGRTLKSRATGWAGLEQQARRLTKTTDGSRPVRRQMGAARCIFMRFQRPAKAKPGQQFMLKGADFYCLHPRTGATVHLGASQRYSITGSAVSIDADMGRFMNSLKFR